MLQPDNHDPSYYSISLHSRGSKQMNDSAFIAIKTAWPFRYSGLSAATYL